MFGPGDVIRKWRIEAGLTLIELAQTSRVNKATISDLERYGKNCERRTLERLTFALGKTMADLYAPLEILESPFHKKIREILLSNGIPAKIIKDAVAHASALQEVGANHADLKEKRAGP